jgi:hypothetical protein
MKMSVLTWIWAEPFTGRNHGGLTSPLTLQHRVNVILVQLFFVFLFVFFFSPPPRELRRRERPAVFAVSTHPPTRDSEKFLRGQFVSSPRLPSLLSKFLFVALRPGRKSLGVVSWKIHGRLHGNVGLGRTGNCKFPFRLEQARCQTLGTKLILQLRFRCRLYRVQVKWVKLGCLNRKL